MGLLHRPHGPTEQHDLAGQQPQRVAALKQALAAHNAEQVEPAWPAQVDVPVNIDKTLLEPDAPDDEYVYTPN